MSCLEEEPADIADPEPAVAPEVGARFMPRGELCLGLWEDACGREVVRECTGPGDETKRSARAEAIDGGDFGRDVRMGKLPGDPESDSRCWFLANVGTKSAPSSSDWKRSERRASRSSNRKSGVDR